MTEENKVCSQPQPKVEPEAEPLPELTMGDILEAHDLPIAQVDVPEWCGSLHIKTLTGSQRDRYMDMVMRRRKGDYVDIKGLKVRLLVQVLCNSEGVCLFTAKQEQELGAKSSAVLDKLFDAAQAHNRLDAETADALAEN